ncbi:isoprenylcysteine carboxylmethyltransferase family protein [Polynucleobacter sp. AP-Nino-20-G2]|uniref:methyltransferase family protein n=1 Tax=Polynucleobacter sp. AP-Nino-20-G2 TaxID=2576917 RepID=UPI001BFDBD72|nr:isoprenylcysteine carboxylmethyltransferase family protein [Polynucleobacter sp. AP-Nino-20-G2]QWE16016.1 isoprenylcysteine carboxylmethyltransferase family protein [Polynucleobacter sp. AP-Nino-20-G2]
MSALSNKTVLQRGAFYVLIQGILIGLILFGPQGSYFISAQSLKTILHACGISIGLLACLIMLVAVINLGKNLTPLPYPKDDAQFVQSGLYRYVRHPIYFGVLLAAIAWLLIFPGIYVLAYVLGLFFLFNVKASREEVWLIERFPVYVDYQSRVKKLIPGLY